MISDSKVLIWPILPYGADDGEGDSDGDSEGDSNSGGNQQNSNQNQQQNQGGTGGNQSSNDDDDDPYAGLSLKEVKRLLKEEEKKSGSTEAARQQLQAKIDAEARKKNDENTNLKNDLDTEKSTNATLRAALAEQAILNGINADKRFEWKNPNIVAQQLNPEIVKVGDDGKVEGLQKELLRISKDENLNFLLVKDNTKQGNQQQQQQQNGSTGFQPGQGGANGGAGVTPNAKELAELMPALRSRI